MPFKLDLHPKYSESSCCHTCKTNGLFLISIIEAISFLISNLTVIFMLFWPTYCLPLLFEIQERHCFSISVPYLKIDYLMLYDLFWNNKPGQLIYQSSFELWWEPLWPEKRVRCKYFTDKFWLYTLKKLWNLTARLNHKWKISCNFWANFQC